MDFARKTTRKTDVQMRLHDSKRQKMGDEHSNLCQNQYMSMGWIFQGSNPHPHQAANETFKEK